MPAIKFPPNVRSSDDIIQFMDPSRTFNLLGSILVESFASKVVFLLGLLDVIGHLSLSISKF